MINGNSLVANMNIWSIVTDEVRHFLQITWNNLSNSISDIRRLFLDVLFCRFDINGKSDGVQKDTINYQLYFKYKHSPTTMKSDGDDDDGDEDNTSAYNPSYDSSCNMIIRPNVNRNM